MHTGTRRYRSVFWRGVGWFFFMLGPLLRWLMNWQGIVIFNSLRAEGILG